MRHSFVRLGVPLLAIVGTLLAPASTPAQATAPRIEPGLTGLGRPVSLDTAVISPTDVWAVGIHQRRHYTHPYTAYASHWDGAAWTTYPTPNPGQYRTYLADIDALSSTDIWAVGEYSDGLDSPSQTLILHWDGVSWTQIESHGVGSLSNQFNGVSALAANDVWAVGISSTAFGTVTLTEHWDGQRWRVVRSANQGGAAENGLAAVTILSPDDVWAVGTFYASGNQRLLAEHWNGSRWKIAPMPDPEGYGGFMTAIYAAASDDVWAVGTNYHVPQHLLMQHWDGSHWSSVDAPTPGTFSWLDGIDGTSSTNIWAVGNMDNRRGPEPLLIEHWDGTTWSDVSIYDRPKTVNPLLFGVSTDAPDDAWAVGEEYDPAAGHDGTGRIVQVRLHWDGTTWS